MIQQSILSMIWLVGTWVRVYKQARFFQIEEYQSPRYLRWWMRERERVFPRKTVIAVVLGMAVAAMFSESPGTFLPVLAAGVAGVVAVWPPDEGEIKKAFVRTSRATRILVATFGITLAVSALCLLFIVLPANGLWRSLATTVAGLGLYLSAPVILVCGSLVVSPVEAFLRRRFLNRARATLDEIRPVVIGITGSYGKTTTKTFMAHLLNGRYKTFPTPKSYNTVMGVCRAVNETLAGDYSIEYFIVEMGAYVEGEIRRICALTPPRISVVVAVGPQHYERFGSMEHVASAKYEIIAALPPDGVGVFNWDDPYVREMYERGHPQTRIAVSRDESPLAYADGGPRFVASGVSQTLHGLTFRITDHATGDSESFATPVHGEHNVTNILLATAVAVHEGMTLPEIALRARMLQPAESRLVLTTLPGGITLINDAYSANPVGVVGALKTLGLHQTGRRLVVTPGMVELGELQEVENRKLGALIAQYATDVILVGAAQTQPVKAGLESAGFPKDDLQVMESVREAMAWYQANLHAGDAVLFLNDLPDVY